MQPCAAIGGETVATEASRLLSLMPVACPTSGRYNTSATLPRMEETARCATCVPRRHGCGGLLLLPTARIGAAEARKAVSRESASADHASRTAFRRHGSGHASCSPRSSSAARTTSKSTDCPTVVWDWGDDTRSESTARLRAVRARQERDPPPLHRRAPVSADSVRLQGLLPPRSSATSPSRLPAPPSRYGQAPASSDGFSLMRGASPPRTPRHALSRARSRLRSSWL